MKVFSIILSDVPGDRLDSIASGPTVADLSTSEQALEVIRKYKLHITDGMKQALAQETPKEITHCENLVIGNVALLCQTAADIAARLGYTPFILTSELDCEAKEAGKVMGSIVRSTKSNSLCSSSFPLPCALIAGGETVVKVTGKGLGGRNQETALAAAISIHGISNAVIFSLGSDGTDGPTDAAGGLIDGASVERIGMSGKTPEAYLEDNDSYHALEESGDLIITGATGTNVNDILVALCI